MNAICRCLLGPSLVSAALVCLTITSANVDAADARRPNVIVVLSDDQGYGDYGCHGNPALKTPNFDRLFAQSVELTDFHVAPVCTPTRGQLMTGLDALHTGTCSVSAGRSRIPRGVPTMAEIFAASGYRTGHFGKWHLGESYPNLPHQRGFQETVYLTGYGITSQPDVWNNDCFNGFYRHNGVLGQYPGYCTDVWFDLAMDWMRKQKADAAEPFFVYLPTNAPHSPYWVADKYKEPYQAIKGMEGFLGMVANLDENMGRLMAMLDETGMAENTILIHFGDNGASMGWNLYKAGMRGHKTMYYEGGHRPACCIRWPAGGLHEPRDISALTEVQDLLPTLIDLCGLKVPPGAHFDGTSLAGLLKGTADALPDRMLVVQYGQTPTKGDAGVLWNKWRLVKDSELYDIASDPGQKTDVAAEHPDVVKKMRDHYNAWWAGVEPNLQNFNPLSIGAKQENPVRLAAVDWANAYFDNVYLVRSGENQSFPWHILVEEDGTYEISLRRWPEEADAAICAAVPEFKAVDGLIPAGVALPIAKAHLKVGDQLDETKTVGSDDKQVTFTVPLKAGLRTTLQSWFLDAKGEPLCGAYYAYILRK
jgi:arylsulfatase A-like enzyme